MSIRSMLFIALAGLAGVTSAQSGPYSSTFKDYQPWKDGTPGDWRAINRTVAAAGDPHAGHDGATAAAGHDHGSAADHDHGKSGHDMSAMHRKMHGDTKDGHDMRAMHDKMHGDAKDGAAGPGSRDMSAMRERMQKQRAEMHGQMHGDAGSGDHAGHDHGAPQGKKP